MDSGLANVFGCGLQLLREKRIAEKHMRMRQKLAEKQARDEAETSEKAAKVEFREQYKAKIEAWQAGKKVMTAGSVRSMLEYSTCS